jgi:hypothetical protein
MAVRTDVTINWEISPRVITVAAPSTSITIQDLNDTLRFLEYSPNPGFDVHSEDYILESEGKFDLRDGVKLTGVSLRLVNAKIAFEARAGPTWAECQITGGNLTAVNSGGSYHYPIEFTAYTSVSFESDTSAALIEGSGGALTSEQEVQLATAATESTLARKVGVNKATVLDNGDDTETVTIYDDNGTSVLYTFTVDKTGNPITKEQV